MWHLEFSEMKAEVVVVAAISYKNTFSISIYLFRARMHVLTCTLAHMHARTDTFFVLVSLPSHHSIRPSARTSAHIFARSLLELATLIRVC